MSFFNPEKRDKQPVANESTKKELEAIEFIKENPLLENDATTKHVQGQHWEVVQGKMGEVRKQVPVDPIEWLKERLAYLKEFPPEGAIQGNVDEVEAAVLHGFQGKE